MKPMRIFPLILALFVAVAPVARAQDPGVPPPQKEQSLPVEVALIYSRLLGQPVDYDALMVLNETQATDKAAFGQAALRAYQREGLKKIYDSYGDDTVLYVRKRVIFDTVDSGLRTAKITNILSDEPFLYNLTATDRYGVFVVNAKELEEIKPPYRYDDFPHLVSSGPGPTKTYPAEIILKPVAADTQPFTLKDGTSVKPLLTHIVDIMVFDENGKDIVIHKRFKDWMPPGERPTLNLQDELMPSAPLKKM